MIRRRMLLALVAATAAAVPATDAHAGGFLGVRIGGDGFGLSVGVGGWAPYHDAWHDPGWQVDLDVALGGYGEWVYVDGLGRVWRPWVAASWRPYTHGRWVSTAAGWTWVAYEPWGWVPHHYGSWALSRHGWVWMPGWEYRPANVVWVSHGGWVGWYPCAPRGWSHHHRGFHHGYRHGWRDGYGRGYGDGYRDGWHDAHHATWTRWGHLGADDLSHHAGPPPDLGVAVARNRVQVLRGGPSHDAVRRAGVHVPEARLERRAVSIDGRRVEMARPVGVEDSIRRHADDTVRRAMPAVVDRREPVRIQPEPERARSERRPAVTEMPAMVRPRGDSRSDQRSKPAPVERPTMGRAAPPQPTVHRSPVQLRPTVEGHGRPEASPGDRRPAPTVRHPASDHRRRPEPAARAAGARRHPVAAPSARQPARAERPATREPVRQPDRATRPAARSPQPASGAHPAPRARLSDERAARPPAEPRRHRGADSPTAGRAPRDRSDR